ncbi:MAG: hypothetical protein A2428_02330 [Bdellovibrionales bacterium RIFOXYC1_FULL_54_43]|nr:MAG: hypothetical protein A2428_02330 [Bdellovibrionales bacterium RIFOXYC1_FULL_54_43]OFZ84688.1 MAG: hypothetical protein A2603_13795 [Bdellovibrionales bacterium RIFOXYD1_FULL_55_31]
MIPVQIAYRDFRPSPAVTADIKERVAKLEQFFNRITWCYVTVGRSFQRHRRGNLYSVRIDLRVPGQAIVTSGRPDYDGAHEDIYVALRDAFNRIQRQLQDYTRQRRIRVHMSEQQGSSRGRVVRILREGGRDGDYGFIEAKDGREIYFHGHSLVHGKFDELKIGSEVRYAEEMGEEGPQASTVEVVGTS